MTSLNCFLKDSGEGCRKATKPEKTDKIKRKGPADGWARVMRVAHEWAMRSMCFLSAALAAERAILVRA